jgi:oxalate decarboxylase/phosphoglucose isomerase-like protein (cupin superfamily)
MTSAAANSPTDAASQSEQGTSVTDPSVTEPFDLSDDAVIVLDRETGNARLLTIGDHGPSRIDGYTIGAPFLTQNAPHEGEMHPDGDELLYLVSGRVNVLLELADGNRSVQMAAGQAVVVPRGVWHRVFLSEPSRLIHMTPGPGGEHRPPAAP